MAVTTVPYKCIIFQPLKQQKVRKISLKKEQFSKTRILRARVSKGQLSQGYGLTDIALKNNIFLVLT